MGVLIMTWLRVALLSVLGFSVLSSAVTRNVMAKPLTAEENQEIDALLEEMDNGPGTTEEASDEELITPGFITYLVILAAVGLYFLVKKAQKTMKQVRPGQTVASSKLRRGETPEEFFARAEQELDLPRDKKRSVDKRDPYA